MAVFTEQRSWTDEHGHARGLKQLSAVAALSARVPCTVVSRGAAHAEGATPLLPRQVGHAVLPWPQSRRDIADLLRFLLRAWSVVGRAEGVLAYAPGVVGAVATAVAILRRKPLVVVAVGNPREALAPEMFPGLAGAVIRTVLARAMTLACRRARVIRYVTAAALQEEFPPGPKSAAFAATDTGHVNAGQPRPAPGDRAVRVLTVASLDQPYKGVAELMEAVIALRSRGRDVRLSIAGTGRLRSELERYGRKRLGDAVRFLGHLDDGQLDAAYQEADCFVLASWSEGLPRALVEAMASGLPAVATRVGGVPELLEPHRLVPPREPEALAAAIARLVEDPAAWTTSAARNIKVAVALTEAAADAEDQFVAAAARAVGSSR
ncbi:glycosyltransferase [Pedococcus sp. 5OH_020]|uniref:glycosyltransferase n=1 Tax=Pedococcus sp. 5OH_020 TaxID=2989814 RepID=UPI0022E9BB87|nr:glycosyltransferase family 4 protein [Pedococcus sp. 5OH_020]